MRQDVIGTAIQKLAEWHLEISEECDRLREERDAAVKQAELWRADFEEAAGHATRRQDELRKACAERDEAKENAGRLQAQLAEAKTMLTGVTQGREHAEANRRRADTIITELQAERDQAVEHAARLHAELYATRKQLQDVCSAKPAEPQQHPAEYTPPEGWRVLQYGELLQPGDQWVNWEGTVSRPDILHGDGATVSGGRYIRQIEPKPEFKPYTFAAYIVGDKRRPHALRIVWATEDWIEFSKFSIVHRISDLQFSGNDTFTPDQFSVNLKIQ